jgi:hypothetical protein
LPGSTKYVRAPSPAPYFRITTTSRWTWGGRQQVLQTVTRLAAPPQPGFPDRFVIEDGRLTECDGEPVRSRLYAALESGQFSRHATEQLQSKARQEFVGCPLKDTVGYLSHVHALPIHLTCTTSKFDAPITLDMERIDLASVLLLIARSQGLHCDCRYGSVWITEDAVADWRDPTGVSTIQPPLGSHLASVWRAPVSLKTWEEPLDVVLKRALALYPIEVDTSALTASETSQPTPKNLASTGYNVVEQPLCDAVGIALYQARCRCELRGETLVVLPPVAERPALKGS